MKKLIILLSVFLLVGCTNTLSNMLTIDSGIKAVLDQNSANANTSGVGFKYYKPRDFSILENDGYNQVLLNNGNKYYLNIDINGYYSKYNEDKKLDSSIYYSNKFSFNDKQGYVEIKEGNNDYFYIKIMYNYSSIETLVLEKYIKEAVINSAIILSSIKYNDNVINHLISAGDLDSKESTYEIKKPSNSSNDKNFLFYDLDNITE